MAYFVAQGTAYCFEEALLQCIRCALPKYTRKFLPSTLQGSSYVCVCVCVFVCVCLMVAGIVMELLCKYAEEGV